MIDKLSASLWLASCCFLPPEKKVALLEYTEDVVALYENFSELKNELTSIVSEEKFERMAKGRSIKTIEEIYEAAQKTNVKIVSYYDSDYPEALKNICDYPLCLFAKGNVALLKTPTIAIVGTRKPTRYGESVTKKFAEELALSGVTVVSGLALGVDTIAHRSAMDCKGSTIGVVASGLDKIYPPENHDLYEKMFVEQLIISEYPMGVPPINYRFIERNRLVSGISRGVLVTEAGEKSGSLITLNLALEQNKNAYCVPGNILSKMSNGTNKMLKDGAAQMVTSADDVLHDYPEITEKKTTFGNSVQLTEIQAVILAVLERGSVHFEELLALTELTVSELMSVLMQMEIVGLVQKLAGNYYSI